MYFKKSVIMSLCNTSSDSSDEWDEYLMENISEKYDLNLRQFWAHGLWKAHSEVRIF